MRVLSNEAETSLGSHVVLTEEGLESPGEQGFASRSSCLLGERIFPHSLKAVRGASSHSLWSRRGLRRPRLALLFGHGRKG